MRGRETTELMRLTGPHPDIAALSLSLSRWRERVEHYGNNGLHAGSLASAGVVT